MVHTEIILQRNCRECLRSSLYLYPLLGLDSLVQAVRVAASLHYTSCLLIDNLHLPVFSNDVLNVAVEHGISLEQLVNRVYTLRFYRILGEQLLLLCNLLFVAQLVVVLKHRELRCNVGQNEQVLVG